MQNQPNIVSDAHNMDRAVEVVGMLGDSVVSVDHIESTDRTPSKRSAHMILLGGAGLLLVSAFAFIKGIAAASANKAALETFRSTLDLPVHQFRPPHQLGLVYDWMAFGGLAGGILAVGLGLALLRRKRAASSYTVGNGVDADYATADLGQNDFQLVRTSDAGTVISLTEQMTGQVNQGGVSLPLENFATSSLVRPSASKPGVWELALPVDASARIETGMSRFLVRSVPADRSRIDSLLGRIDRGAAKFVGYSAAAHLALVAFLGTIPPDPRSLSLETGTTEHRQVSYASAANEKPIEKLNDKGVTNDGNVGAGMSLPGEDGASGDPSSNNAAARRTVKNRSEDKHLARATAMTHARNSGVAGALRSSSAFRSMSSFSDFSSGHDEYDNLGGLDGEPGSQRGTFGNGRSGIGMGTGWNPIYSGNYNTIGGPGSSATPGWPGKKGPKKLHTRDSKAPTKTKFSDVRSGGGLDASIVRRYLRRQRARFQHCYERELQASPGLRGTVKVSFIISGTGAVLSARSSGMPHSSLRSCVNQTVNSIKFPRSGDGSTVKVNYALHYTSAG